MKEAHFPCGCTHDYKKLCPVGLRFYQNERLTWHSASGKHALAWQVQLDLWAQHNAALAEYQRHFKGAEHGL